MRLESRSRLAKPEAEAGSQRHHLAPKLTLQSSGGFKPSAMAGCDKLDTKALQVLGSGLNAFCRCLKEVQTSDYRKDSAIPNYFFRVVQRVDQPGVSAAGNDRPTAFGFDQQRLIVRQGIGLRAGFIDEERIGGDFVSISPRNRTRHEDARGDFRRLHRFDEVSGFGAQSAFRSWWYADMPVRRCRSALKPAVQRCRMGIDLAPKTCVDQLGDAPGVVEVAMTDNQGIGSPKVNPKQVCIVP